MIIGEFRAYHSSYKGMQTFFVHLLNGEISLTRNGFYDGARIGVWPLDIQCLAYQQAMKKLLEDRFINVKDEVNDLRERVEKAERTIEHVRDIFREILEIDT